MLARWWRRHARDADCGTVTAEFAVVLPCVAAVAILVLCLGRASIVSMNCQDAAAAGARAMAIDHCRWRFHGVVRRQCEQRHRCGALPGCGGSDRRAARQRRGQGNSVFLIAMFMTACCP